MAYRYKLTPLVASDIDDALNYISYRLLNPGAAANLYHELQQEIASICASPHAFPDCSCYLIDDDTIRHSVVGNYVLIYEVSDKEKLIKILRFLYGGMDIVHMAITDEYKRNFISSARRCMVCKELDAKLQHSYDQSLRGEGRPFEDVFDDLEWDLA